MHKNLEPIQMNRITSMRISFARFSRSNKKDTKFFFIHFDRMGLIELQIERSVRSPNHCMKLALFLFFIWCAHTRHCTAHTRTAETFSTNIHLIAVIIILFAAEIMKNQIWINASRLSDYMLPLRSTYRLRSKCNGKVQVIRWPFVIIRMNLVCVAFTRMTDRQRDGTEKETFPFCNFIFFCRRSSIETVSHDQTVVVFFVVVVVVML